ncbi:hypothetical protein [Bacillus toyonensis]|uniref:hypothetical protein n=1 Tax=Bacillus toyonensis TaxID=155322 RepID=UPI00027A2205|nr:hypothetical protein [Bacillus toyonensis]EJR67523.1 hypothetical protein IIO_00511 [Bacillus cereus VD115]MBU4640077.1 hypothetical protein [Bacillus toyonensis]
MNHLVLNAFIDKETKIGYSKGDMYESTDSGRIAFLVEKRFLQGNAVPSKFPKHTGGGWYELSNGEKVQGKDEAISAEKSLRGA